METMVILAPFVRLDLLLVVLTERCDSVLAGYGSYGLLTDKLDSVFVKEKNY